MFEETCKIIPKRIETFNLRLFEEEIDESEFLAFYYDLNYEQLFIKLVKEKLDRILKNKMEA